MNDHYDVIIIVTGACGGTVLNKLAPSGKRILVLERGPFLPRVAGETRKVRITDRAPASHGRDA